MSEAPRGRAFWIGAVLGWGVMAFGVIGVLGAARRTRPVELGLFLVGGALVHDLLVAPVVLLVAAVAARVVPPVARRGVSVFLFAAGAIALFSFPFIRGYGRNPTNPSILPNDYAAGLAIVIAFIAVAALGWTALGVARRRNRA